MNEFGTSEEVYVDNAGIITLVLVNDKGEQLTILETTEGTDEFAPKE